MDIISEIDTHFYSTVYPNADIDEYIQSIFISSNNRARGYLPDNIIEIRNDNDISSPLPSTLSGHDGNWRQNMNGRCQPTENEAIIATSHSIYRNEPVGSREEVYPRIIQSEKESRQIRKNKKAIKEHTKKLKEILQEWEKKFIAFKLESTNYLEFQKYQRLFISKKAKQEHILNLQYQFDFKKLRYTYEIRKIKNQIADLKERYNRLHQQLTVVRQEKMHCDRRPS